MSATALWTAVKTRYDEAGLRTLTNIRDRSQASIDDTAGESAAQTVITLFSVYAQVVYDASEDVHLEVAVEGVIATLWKRGGTSAEIAKVRWDDVFGEGGLLEKVKRTDPRSHRGPSSNSNVRQASGLTAGGRRKRGWSDEDSLPTNHLPRPEIARDYL